MSSDPSLASARLVFVTHPPEGAEAFAATLVEAGLAACVNLLAARSVYRWEGVVERADETLLVVKTRAERLTDLGAHLSQHHPFDTPELVALPPSEVEPNYLAWLLASVPVQGPSS